MKLYEIGFFIQTKGSETKITICVQYLLFIFWADLLLKTVLSVFIMVCYLHIMMILISLAVLVCCAYRAPRPIFPLKCSVVSRLTITIVAKNFVVDFAGESVQQISMFNILFKLSYHLWQMDMQNFTGSRKILQR